MAAHVAQAPSDAQARGPRHMAGPRGPPGPLPNIPVVDREKVRIALFFFYFCYVFYEFVCRSK